MGLTTILSEFFLVKLKIAGGIRGLILQMFAMKINKHPYQL
jgi:hypothetical protein